MTTPRGPSYPWAEIVAKLRSTPGRWVLHPRMTARSPRIARQIIERRAKPLQISDGTISTHLSNRTMNTDGEPIADIWLRFTPKEEA